MKVEHSLLYNKIYYQELVKISYRLNKDKKKHLFLKGPLLSLFLHNSLPKRPLRDIDLLILRKDFNKVKLLLQNLGYQMYYDPNVSLNRYLGKYPKHQEIAFKKKIGQIILTLDLHQDLIGPTFGGFPYPLSYLKTAKLTQEAFRQVITFRTNNKSYKIFNPSFQLFYLCLNSFFHHNCIDFNTNQRIRELLNTKINWNSVKKLCQKYSVTEFIFFSIYSLGSHHQIPPDLFGKNVPSKTALILVSSLFKLQKKRQNTSQPNQYRLNALSRIILLKKPAKWKFKQIFKSSAISKAPLFLKAIISS